jgi:hypothetical protein
MTFNNAFANPLQGLGEVEGPDADTNAVSRRKARDLRMNCTA